MHIHVECAEGEAKFWLEPSIVVAHNSRLNSRRLREIRILIEANADEIRTAWAKHFES